MKNDKMAVCFVTYAHARGCALVGKQAVGITRTKWEELPGSGVTNDDIMGKMQGFPTKGIKR